MSWSSRTRKLSASLLLFVSAIQGMTPDTQDLASHFVFHVLLIADHSDPLLDNDGMPDDVCSASSSQRASSSRRSALMSASLNSLASRHHLLSQIDIAPAPRSTRERMVGLHIRPDRLHQLCRLTC
jgi:hypothetical protein